MHFINLDESSFFLFANDPPYPSHFDDESMVAHWTPLTYSLGEQFKVATHFVRIQVLCPAQVMTQALLSSVLNFASIWVSETTFTWTWSTILVFGDNARNVELGKTRIEKALNCYGLVVEESHRSTRILRSLKDTGLLYEEKRTLDGRLQYTVRDTLPLLNSQ
jgi:hypothetical protein